MRFGSTLTARRIAGTALRGVLAILACVLCFPALLHAQGGPPFRTDDPETPGNKQWEINFGLTADHNPGNASYETPNFDINYGLGDRIQLKYEIPIASHTDANNTTSTGLGESLLGVKFRFYQHDAKASEGSEPEPNFSLSTYPQLGLDNPTNSVRRDVVPPGPRFLLPLEINGRIGPLRFDVEGGRWFNSHGPDSWIRGGLIGHEFTAATELYVELYGQQDTARVGTAPLQREATLGLGGRHAFNRNKSLLLLFMGGRSFQTVTRTNGQPDWIAYLGLQVLLGKHSPAP